MRNQLQSAQQTAFYDSDGNYPWSRPEFDCLGTVRQNICLRKSWQSFTQKLRTELTGWMECHCGHGVHVWLRNILDYYGNIKVPGPDRLVIRSRDKATILIHECDRVYWAQMLIILLRNFSRIDVILGLSVTSTQAG